MKKRARTRRRAGQPKAFDAWCIYRADGKPSITSTGVNQVSVAHIRTSRLFTQYAVEQGNEYIPDGAPHRAVRVRITPIVPRPTPRRPRRA